MLLCLVARGSLTGSAASEPADGSSCTGPTPDSLFLRKRRHFSSREELELCEPRFAPGNRAEVVVHGPKQAMEIRKITA